MQKIFFFWHRQKHHLFVDWTGANPGFHVAQENPDRLLSDLRSGQHIYGNILKCLKSHLGFICIDTRNDRCEWEKTHEWYVCSRLSPLFVLLVTSPRCSIMEIIQMQFDTGRLFSHSYAEGEHFSVLTVNLKAQMHWNRLMCTFWSMCIV